MSSPTLLFLSPFPHVLAEGNPENPAPIRTVRHPNQPCTLFRMATTSMIHDEGTSTPAGAGDALVATSS